MKLILAVVGLYAGDAIGNDVIAQYQHFRAQGHEVEIYSLKTGRHLSVQSISRQAFLNHLQTPQNILILHHGKSWDGADEFLNTARCRVVLRYHNITPGQFFAPFHAPSQQESDAGEAQTQRWVQSGKIHAYLAASEYNAQQLINMGAQPDKMIVIPPFHRINELLETSTVYDLAERLMDGKINILFVGRMAPNKNIEALIKAIRCFIDHYDIPIRLNLVGGSDPALYHYIKSLHTLVHSLNLTNHVQFCGTASLSELHTYYLYSHAFLLLSKHEGFCVPILEAQAHYLPVIAWDQAAVKDTLGPNQILLPSDDPILNAAAIHTLLADTHLRATLAETGFANWKATNQRLSTFQLETVLEKLV